MSAKQDLKKTAQTPIAQVPSGRSKAVILQRNGRFHEWNDACKARIISTKPRWITVWDNPRAEPKPMPISEILAELKGEVVNPYEDQPAPNNNPTVQRRLRAGSQTSSTSSATVQATAPPEGSATANEDDTLSKEAAKMFRDDLSRIKAQREEVFADLWSHLSRDVQSNIEMHRHWRMLRDRQDVVKFLEVIENAVSGHTGKDDISARLQAETELYGVKQRISQTVSEYADEVRAAFAKAARFLSAGEAEPSQDLKVLVFVRGLSNAHDEYKTSFHDRRRAEQPIPKSIDDAKEDLFEFERDRAIIGQGNAKRRQKGEQLAIHRTTNPSDAKTPPVDDKKRGREAKASDRCNYCKELGHFKRDCPKLQHQPATVGSITLETAGNETTMVNRVRRLRMPTWVNLDSGAETSVFANASLITDLHQGEAVTVKTVAGKKTLNTWGYFGTIKVLYDPSAEANLLSQHDLELASEHVTFVPGVSWTSVLSATGDELEFSKPETDEFGAPNKFYCHAPTSISIGGITTTEREKMFPKAEVERARGARALKLRLGGASDADVIRFLRDGVAVGCPFTPADVRRATAIYGHDIADLKGKMTSRGPSRATVIDVPGGGEQKNQNLFVDVFDLEGQLFVLAIMKPMKYCFCAILNGRSAEDMESAMKSIINMATSKGFNIVKIEADPEPAIVKIKDTLGVPVDLVGAGSHVPVAEREGRVVKERCRLIKDSLRLPFDVPARLNKFLVMFVVTRLNLMPRSTDGQVGCPRERFTGKKLLYRKDLELGFGDYTEVWSKPDVTNGMEKRSISAIALYPAGNDQGSWYFYDLSGGTVFQRSHWKPLPMPDIVNPSLDVPRYGPDGARLDVSARTKRARARGAAHEPIAAVEPASPPEVEDRVDDGNADIEQELTVDDTWDLSADPAQSAEGEIPCEEHDVGEEEESPCADETAELPRRSQRIASRMLGHVSVRESIEKLGIEAELALKREFQQMVDMDVYEPVRLEALTEDQRKRVIHSSAFVKEKVDESGKVTSVKARWVGSGNQMNRELYETGSSPTVSTETLFAQLALAAGEKMDIITIDIGSAYLHSDMNEFVAVYIAPHLAKYAIAVDSRLAPFQDSRGRVLVRLKKALYGCVQSSRLWYETMSETLHAAGFRANDYDRCLFHKGERGDQISICLHVDDLLVTSTSQRRTNELLSALRARFREVKVRQGAENGYLGMRLTTAEDKLTVDMIAYIDECLKECPSTATHATPADSTLFVVGESVELGAKEKEYFHSMVARLLYLAKRTRPDILTAVSPNPNLLDRAGD
eukprot:gene15043-10761_t